MLSLLVWFIVLIVVFAIVWWIVQQIPIPPQFRWVVNVILGLIFLIIVVSLLMGGFGGVGLGHPILR